MISFHLDYYTAGLIAGVYLLGFVLALNSVFQSRTPQGAMAWVLALIFIPFLSVPMFLIFGKKRIEDYEQYEMDIKDVRREIETGLSPFRVGKHDADEVKTFLMRNEFDFLVGHDLKLLINAEEAYREMLDSIRSAEKYIMLQMYIFRTDRIGTVFANELSKKAEAGVKIYILYESLGINLVNKTIRQMKKAGVKVGDFSPMKGNKTQINFRNHRKLLIVDGRIGYLGGINIGDDYLGRNPAIGFWRDTNVRIEGPVVSQAQIDFVKDWKFSQKIPIEFEFSPPVAKGVSNVLLMNSGPAEERPANLLQHIEMFTSAKKRLWIANPYIVPPQGLIDAILIATIRGVDVRILVPERSDNILVQYAMQVYLERLTKAGVRIFKYTKGMMHQKVLLIDEKLAMVGSTNLDFRSMYINFENSIVSDDEEFIKELEFAIRKDFENSIEVGAADFRTAAFPVRLACHLANSLAPVL